MVVIQQPYMNICLKRREIKHNGKGNRAEEPLINNFADLKTLSSAEQHQTEEVISISIVLVKVKSARQRKDLLAYP